MTIAFIILSLVLVYYIVGILLRDALNTIAGFDPEDIPAPDIGATLKFVASAALAFIAPIFVIVKAVKQYDVIIANLLRLMDKPHGG